MWHRNRKAWETSFSARLLMSARTLQEIGIDSQIDSADVRSLRCRQLKGSHFSVDTMSQHVYSSFPSCVLSKVPFLDKHKFLRRHRLFPRQHRRRPRQASLVRRSVEFCQSQRFSGIRMFVLRGTRTCLLIPCRRARSCWRWIKVVVAKQLQLIRRRIARFRWPLAWPGWRMVKLRLRLQTWKIYWETSSFSLFLLFY